MLSDFPPVDFGRLVADLTRGEQIFGAEGEPPISGVVDELSIRATNRVGEADRMLFLVQHQDFSDQLLDLRAQALSFPEQNELRVLEQSRVVEERSDRETSRVFLVARTTLCRPLRAVGTDEDLVPREVARVDLLSHPFRFSALRLDACLDGSRPAAVRGTQGNSDAPGALTASQQAPRQTLHQRPGIRLGAQADSEAAKDGRLPGGVFANDQRREKKAVRAFEREVQLLETTDIDQLQPFDV